MTTTPDEPARRQCNVRLPVDLVEQIDARRELKGMSRDRWMEHALRYALSKHPAPNPATRPRT